MVRERNNQNQQPQMNRRYRLESPVQQRMPRIQTDILEQDLRKSTRVQLLKIAKKMGIQNLHAKYLSKNYLVDLVKNTSQVQKQSRAKRGNTPVRINNVSNYRTTKSGMQVRSFKPSILERSQATHEEMSSMFHRIKRLQTNNRTNVSVVIIHEDGGYETVSIDNLIDRENIYKGAKNFTIANVNVSTLPLRGGCDTKEHIINSVHYLPNGQSMVLKLKSVKTTNNNCLINIFSKTAGLKQINALSLRKKLKLNEGALDVNVCDTLSNYFQVSYILLSYEYGVVRVIKESQQVFSKYVEIFLDNKINHYYIIQKRPNDLALFKPQIQIEESISNVETGADQIVQMNPTEEQHAEYTNDIKYAQVLDDPDFKTIEDIVYNTTHHVAIFGEGGVGKTWTINHLDLPNHTTKTATTGLAATHINGNTIHYHLKKKLEDCSKIIIVDEVSMMGTALFQQLYQLINEKGHRLVIAGDLLQLPPIQDGFFFQCYDFVKFAKKCVRINLTKIKRQENKEQQIFLNNLRVGTTDKQILKDLSQNIVEDPDVVICGTNASVDKHNKIGIESLQQETYNFQPQFIYNEKSPPHILKKVKNDYTSVELCLHAKVMLLHNINVQRKLVNGQIGKIVKISQEQVTVQFDFGVFDIPYVQEDFDNLRVQYMPLRLCYAITVHKSQGCTFNSAIVEIDDLFENGQAYVALSRVRDLNKLQIKGKIDECFTTKAFRPNQIARDFLYKNVMMTQSEIMLINYSEKQLKGMHVKRYQDINTIWNHIYLDFETDLIDNNGLPSQQPYYNKIKHFKNGKFIYEKRLFDQKWIGGERCDVGTQSWEYVKQVMISHGDNLKNLKEQGTVASFKIYKSEKKKIPTICAFNGSGFDFHFILKRFLNDTTCSKRFEISNIFKGSKVSVLIVRDKQSGEIVLKTHDICEILLCPLKKALTDFCQGSISNEIVEKIEFKDEILYIMNNYEKNPEILKPGVESIITKKLYTFEGVIEKELPKRICLHDEVIKYADNDTDVLHTLYLCLDKLSKETLNANITSFPTAGNMAWYGIISNLPKEAINDKYDKHGNEKPLLDTKLFRLEMKELDFVQKSIKGAKSLPRIHQVPKLFDKYTHQRIKYVYLDISGMYASIMKNEIFPYGKARFASNNQLKQLNNFIQSIQEQYKTNKLSWRDIFNQLTKKFGCFIAETDFEENPMNLEPIIQYTHEGRTYYTVERRTDTISSVSISCIIQSGGQIFNINRAMFWDNHGQILKDWIIKCNAIKEEGQRTGNSGMKNFGKLLANSAYGQTLMSDRNEVTQFINTFEDADEFVNKNTLSRFFEMDEYDVYIGKKVVSGENFISSRCQHIGAFVLEYSKAIIHDICDVAMPNRYNQKGITEQPLYGDTDSLVFQDWQADLLIKAGWVKFENGKLTDELGEKSYWFLPDRLKDISITDSTGKVITIKDGFNELIHEEIWNQATEQEKTDPANFHFYHVIDGIFAAPKSYACKYTNNDGTKINDKMKFKGIPISALIGDKTLNYEIIREAYNNPNKCYVATLQSKPQVIKNFTSKEGKKAFLEIVDSNLRRDKFVSRQLFKSKWRGRYHVDDNFTVPYGWNRANLIQV